MLVEGRHFFADVDPYALGHKALAVNLSDLAAMGAQPHAFTLALALPRADEAWLAAFSDGLFALAERYDCELIGGDTTSGPLNLCITVFGDVPPNAALRRDAARPGDDIWVSGTLGDARAGLGLLRGEWPAPDDDAAARLKRALERPEPRVALGLALRGVAHAALDISDGLAGDLHAHPEALERARRRRCRRRAALRRAARAARRRAPRLHARRRRRLRTVLHRARRGARQRSTNAGDERERAAHPHRYNRSALDAAARRAVHRLARCRAARRSL